MARGKTSLGGSLAFIAIVGLIVFGSGIQNYQQSHSGNSGSNATAAITSTPTPRPTATPRPVSVRNGEVLQQSDYQEVCSFKVKASDWYNYYIYLQYKGAPARTSMSRERKSYATAPYESDIVFYVEKGKEAEAMVPVGNYKLFYATGDTYFGKELLFGNRTSYYTSDDILDFYTDENYTYGHTVTLQVIAGGNMDSDMILGSQFPGR